MTVGFHSRNVHFLQRHHCKTYLVHSGTETRYHYHSDSERFSKRVKGVLNDIVYFFCMSAGKSRDARRSSFCSFADTKSPAPRLCIYLRKKTIIPFRLRNHSPPDRFYPCPSSAKMFTHRDVWVYCNYIISCARNRLYWSIESFGLAIAHSLDDYSWNKIQDTLTPQRRKRPILFTVSSRTRFGDARRHPAPFTVRFLLSV